MTFLYSFNVVAPRKAEKSVRSRSNAIFTFWYVSLSACTVYCPFQMSAADFEYITSSGAKINELQVGRLISVERN